MDNKVLITTRVGKYVWFPLLQLIDFIPVGKRKAEFTIHLKESENTELRAMIKTTQNMLSLLRETLKARENG